MVILTPFLWYLDLSLIGETPNNIERIPACAEFQAESDSHIFAQKSGES
jgi:hypothetical protein